MIRKLKSNDLGKLLEDSVVGACLKRDCTHFRLHTIRSFKGVSNPCDFIVLEKSYTALLECKATGDDKFSCSRFTQLPHFEKTVLHSHVGIYGVVVYFYCESPMYVFATDKKVIENKQKRRPIRVGDKNSYDLISDNIDDLLDGLQFV